MIRPGPQAQAGRMTARELARTGVALLIGAAVALPVGVVIGRLGDAEPVSSVSRPGTADMRDMFSPSVRTDPYFLDRQREGVEALERHCARTGESCFEARAARQRLSELEATD